MKRCFVAMRLSEPTRDAIAKVQEDLSRLPPTAAKRIRPVRRENLHLTLKFLGATADGQVEEVMGRLGEIAASYAGPPDLAAEIVGLSAFPSVARPRVVFGRLTKGRETQSELARRVEAACASLGFEPEGRSRIPHVTCARVERARTRGRLTAFIEERAALGLGTIDSTAIVLFESTLRPGGSLYAPLGELPVGTS